jgi:hypothetical protein
MTEREKPDEERDGPSFAEIEPLLAPALRASGLGIPETEGEVRAFEAELVRELSQPLPASLGSPPELEPTRVAAARALPHEPAMLRDARRIGGRFGRAAAFAAVVALTAGVSFWIGVRRQADAALSRHLDGQPGAATPSSVALAPSATSSLSGAPIAVLLDASCDADGASRCCSGASCPLSAGKACPSGRSCVRCELGDAGLERWRVRFNDLWLTPQGQELLASHHPRQTQAEQGALSLCLSVGRAGRRACRPASGSGTTSGAVNAAAAAKSGAASDAGSASRGDVAGAFLVSSSELLSGFSVDVVANADGALLGSWSTPVQVTPAVLCGGVLAKPSAKDGLLLGAASFFLDDAQFVEIAGFSSVDPAERAAKNLRIDGAALTLFETTRSDVERFTLAVGPLSFSESQQLRWRLLKAGSAARVSVGEGFVEPGRVLGSASKSSTPGE